MTDDGRTVPALTRRRERHVELLPADHPLPALQAGEQLALRRPVPGDATYEEPMVVRSAGGDGPVLLEPVGDRERQQQRDFVRVPASGITMEVEEVPPTDVIDDGEGDAPREHAVRVLDVSAGGARVAHPGARMPRGSTWRVRALLTYEDGTELPLDEVAEVRWSSARTTPAAEVDAPDDVGALGDDAAVAGLQFLSMRPRVEERVTRWVFQQQARWLQVRRRRRGS